MEYLIYMGSLVVPYSVALFVGVPLALHQGAAARSVDLGMLGAIGLIVAVVLSALWFQSCALLRLPSFAWERSAKADALADGVVLLPSE